MRINNSNGYTPTKKKDVSFSGSSNFSKGFDKFADKCNIGQNGSLTRPAFLAISSLFMIGARFFKSRGEDERREVLTRDVPGITLAVYGAPVLNSGLAYLVTKRTGIPILQYAEKLDRNLKNASFASQKQVKDWYSSLKELKNPLITFSETIERNGGNIKKVMTKLGLESKLKDITGKDDATNKEIIDSFKKLQSEKSEKFSNFEGEIRNIADDNKVLKIAKNTQAAVKVSGILFTAALLGIILPRLNILTTKKKYQQKAAAQSQQKTESKETEPKAQATSKSI